MPLASVIQIISKIATENGWVFSTRKTVAIHMYVVIILHNLLTDTNFTYQVINYVVS